MRILIISYSKLENDARVTRTALSLARCHEVTTLGFGKFNYDSIDHIVCGGESKTFLEKCVGGLLLLTRRYTSYYWNLLYVRDTLEKIKKRYDLIVANDIESLPVAARRRKDGKIWLDLHEYVPREFEDDFKWRLLFKGYKEFLCRRYLGYADAITTVCGKISDEYRKNFGVPSQVIVNAPSYDPMVRPRRCRPNEIRIVHHGSAIPNRKIEKTIEMMKYLGDQYRLDMILIGKNESYKKKLKKMAEKDYRIRFPEPHPVSVLIEELNHYDIGIFSLPPVNFNYQYALPNKLFDFIHARLAVVIGPSPEMEKVVEEFGCGVVAQGYEPQELADAVGSINHEKIERYKYRSHLAARALSHQNNEKLIRSILDRIM